jgi:uncharacterized protein with von Willebrand factor type A (vWA) domain
MALKFKKQKTAVEQLIEDLNEPLMFETLSEWKERIFKKALKAEQEQLIKAFQNGVKNGVL